MPVTFVCATSARTNKGMARLQPFIHSSTLRTALHSLVSRPNAPKQEPADQTTPLSAGTFAKPWGPISVS